MRQGQDIANTLLTLPPIYGHNTHPANKVTALELRTSRQLFGHLKNHTLAEMPHRRTPAHPHQQAILSSPPKRLGDLFEQPDTIKQNGRPAKTAAFSSMKNSTSMTAQSTLTQKGQHS